MEGPVSQPSVASTKEGSRTTTNDQLEGLEHIRTLQTFQDGRAPSIKVNFETKELSIQVGPQKGLFLCSIEQTIEKICMFQMEGSLCQYFCLCLGLSLATKVVYKISYKVPASILCKLNIRTMAYLRNFLIITKIVSRDKVIYLLQNLGFIKNLMILVLHPTQGIEFLWMMIHLVEMTVSLP